MPCGQNNTEIYYANAANYCHDTPLTGALHPQRRCYREIPIREGLTYLPPGDQVCFDALGNCEDSADKVSPVACKNSDGSCVLSLPGSIGHVVYDMLPAVSGLIILAGIGYVVGTLNEGRKTASSEGARREVWKSILSGLSAK